MARKPSDTVQLKLRFPEGLRRRLEREARRHGQSLNREIVSILEERFRESDDADRRAAAFADALRDEFIRLYREDKARGQAAGEPLFPLLSGSLTATTSLPPQPWLSPLRATPSLKPNDDGEKK
jgi:uncharacterized membrane protein YccC